MHEALLTSEQVGVINRSRIEFLLPSVLTVVNPSILFPLLYPSSGNKKPAWINYLEYIEQSTTACSDLILTAALLFPVAGIVVGELSPSLYLCLL